jgi:NAD-dependent deacetylase sirtuin 2
MRSVGEGLRDGRYKNVIVMAGAGMSTSAGIPDFRTPRTGLYDQLRERGIEEPTDLFDIDFFKSNPTPFHHLALEMLRDEGEVVAPTDMHRFVAKLEERGVLLRCFTQNIDGLELKAGLSTERVVQAHGGFRSASCVECGANHDAVEHECILRRGETPRCDACGGLVKFNVVFFDEGLPARFYHRVDEDFKHCDLLLIVGTSLSVQPFASLVGRVPDDCPRVLINHEPVGMADFAPIGWPPSRIADMEGLHYNDPVPGRNTRDSWWLDDCDTVADKVAQYAGW